MENIETNTSISKEFLEIYVLSFTEEALKKFNISEEENEEEPDEDGVNWDLMGIPNPNKSKKNKEKPADLLTKDNTFWKKYLVRPGLILEITPYYLKKLDLPATQLYMDYGETYIVAGKTTDFETLLDLNKVTVKPDYIDTWKD